MKDSSPMQLAQLLTQRMLLRTLEYRINRSGNRKLSVNSIVVIRWSMERKRRTILKNAGATLVGIGSLSNVTGATGKPDRGPGASEIGIKKAVDKHLEKGRIQKAHSLLEKHNVSHGFDHLTVPTAEMQGGDVSIQEADYSESQFWFHWYEREYPHYNIMNQFEIEGTGGGDKTSALADGVGFGWAGDKWEYDYPSFESGTMGHDDDYINNPDSKGSGLVAEYHGVEMLDGQEKGGWARINIEKQEPGKHNVWAHYGHTWEAWWEDYSAVTFGISYGGASLSVSLEGGTGKWKTDDADYGVLEI